MTWNENDPKGSVYSTPAFSSDAAGPWMCCAVCVAPAGSALPCTIAYKPYIDTCVNTVAEFDMPPGPGTTWSPVAAAEFMMLSRTAEPTTTWPRTSPLGLPVVWTLKYAPNVRTASMCAADASVHKCPVKDPVGSVQNTEPSTPATPACRCAAVWSTTFSNCSDTSRVVSLTMVTRPRPNAVVATGVVCCAPVNSATPTSESATCPRSSPLTLAEVMTSMYEWPLEMTSNSLADSANDWFVKDPVGRVRMLDPSTPGTPWRMNAAVWPVCESS